MAIPESTPQKNQLRATMRRVLREHELDSGPVCEALYRWLSDHPAARTVAVYSPLSGEVDPAAAIARHPDLRWVYPKVVGDHLTFHTGENLTAGSFGILEPHGDTPEIPVREIDVFLCPGLAFDRQGGRLGRGRGFYDRLLAGARADALKIGVCFPEQLVPDTFSEAHDVRMDEVISPEPA